MRYSADLTCLSKPNLVLLFNEAARAPVCSAYARPYGNAPSFSSRRIIRLLLNKSKHGGALALGNISVAAAAAKRL